MKGEVRELKNGPKSPTILVLVLDESGRCLLLTTAFAGQTFLVPVEALRSSVRFPRGR